MAAITPEQVESYHVDGYAAVRSVIDSGTLARLRGTLAELLDKAAALTDSDDVFILEAGHSAADPRLQRVSHPVAVRDVFWQVATSDAVLDCVESLIGPNIRFHHSKLNFKARRGGVRIGWHQDFAFFPHTNYDVLACGIAIEDATVDNGCLMVIPGSHKMPILNHRDEAGEFVGEIKDGLATDDADRAAPVELAAGDMSIHNACVIHGSAPNESGCNRPLLIFEYTACDALPLEHRPPANEYSDRVVRGNETPHARLAGAVTLPLRGDISTAKSIFARQQKAMMR